ncbi:hypothetical protein NLI96_g10349 [Meripilus lineatus]|uniref:DUF6532 domain-containing protein n=1 Tax=Meripilus lineatus TaxID=2056292 RepID=A0AAD5UVK1_9APHY|nr:hypothetical protein NLI96_g10349 [Physisporinus lineatus]
MELAGRFFRIRLATIDIYPSDSEVVSWIKGSVHQACTEKNAPRRYERFNQDVVYSRYIFKLVKKKIGQLRNSMKDVSMSSILDAYGLAVLTMTEQEIANRVKFLLHDHGFAFENPDNRTGLFRHPIFFTVAMGVWFNSSRKDAIKFSQSFNPIPLPTLALIATAVKFALECWLSGHKVCRDFEADRENIGAYRGFMSELMEFKAKMPAVVADIQYTLWRKIWAASGYAPVAEASNIRKFSDRDFGIVPQEEASAHAESNGPEAGGSV